MHQITRLRSIVGKLETAQLVRTLLVLTVGSCRLEGLEADGWSRRCIDAWNAVMRLPNVSKDGGRCWLINLLVVEHADFWASVLVKRVK